jgi:hypothetical protein
MALTDINISEQLETSAPSIKYEGNEGPQSPQDERMAQLKNEYMQYVFEMKDIGEPVMSFEEWYQAVYEASRMGVDAGQQPQQPQLQPQPQPMMRQPVAYGGIMDLGGRRQYGLGSSIKKRIRKLIPNEAADIATKAAPFVAMVPGWGPAAAGVMRGLGRFDQRGSISDALKQGLLTYGGGKAFGAGMEHLNLRDPGASGISEFFSKPTQRSVSNLNPFKKATPRTWQGGTPSVYPTDVHAGENIAGAVTKDSGKNLTEKLSLGKRIMKKIDDYAVPIMLGAMGLSAATATPQDMKAAASRGEGMDIDSIREEVRVALADPTGEKWIELQKKYPYMGEQATKKAAEGGIMRLGYDDGGEAGMVEETITKINERALATARAAKEAGIPLTEEQEQMIQQATEQGLAYGGRAAFYAGGQSIPSEYTIEDAMMTTTQDKLGGITDVMKQADLFRQGSVGQFYAAHGGRIGAQEGGLMDLGGMEKDYRNDGGFVPLGGEEKADDVPARLSKNEFVFTADAVRGAGGGDIDKGAEIMENMMKNLEQGGQISEESQGLSGAQEMFDVSERLSEVV